MIYAMDQLERIDPEAGNLLWIDLDFNKRRLVGFVTPAEDTAYFIVGLVAPESCQSALKIDPPSASKIDPPQVVVFSY